MAYGTPATPADVEAYYTHVRRGRPPPPDLLADLRRRYDAIGGTSPLLERTRAQASGLAAALGDGYVVELGMKHAPPFIEDGVERLVAAGAGRAVGLVLAPHYSALSVGEYMERARSAAAGRLEMAFVESWHLVDGYLRFLAAGVTEALEGIDVAPVEVVFTAHSLPARILASADPYSAQLAETAQAVADRTGLDRWRVAWQSAGRTPEPWIGPDLLSVLPDLAADGVAGVVACPAGFVSDHLEILYDLDIEARQVAEKAGIVFARTEMPNADPRFIEALAAVVRDHLDEEDTR